MEFSTADMPLARPNGASAIYGKVIRATERPRDMERRVFEQITAELETAEDPGAPFTARIEAMHRNRELWLTLTCALADEHNALPSFLRASIISIGLWVLRETHRLMRNSASLADLVAVNRSIIHGLAAASEGAS
jgi:flagellar protein FlaF